MTKIDQLIAAFKEFKEELNKNVNQSYSQAPNAATGTSGGQGGMYRSEHMDKNIAPMSASPGGAQDMSMIKYDKNGQWRLEKDAANPALAPKDKKVKMLQQQIDAGTYKPDSKKIAGAMLKPFGKEEHNQSYDGKNRESSPKLRASDLGPGGKVHMIKEESEKCEGTNQEANPSYPHNKGKFKVMPMTPEKSEKHAGASGKPYNGADKDVKKAEKQGNEAKGFDENKAPGRGTLTV